MVFAIFAYEWHVVWCQAFAMWDGRSYCRNVKRWHHSSRHADCRKYGQISGVLFVFDFMHKILKPKSYNYPVIDLNDTVLDC